jgi:hypothetical protein
MKNESHTFVGMDSTTNSYVVGSCGALYPSLPIVSLACACVSTDSWAIVGSCGETIVSLLLLLLLLILVWQHGIFFSLIDIFESFLCMDIGVEMKKNGKGWL